MVHDAHDDGGRVAEMAEGRNSHPQGLYSGRNVDRQVSGAEGRLGEDGHSALPPLPASCPEVMAELVVLHRAHLRNDLSRLSNRHNVRTSRAHRHNQLVHLVGKRLRIK